MFIFTFLIVATKVMKILFISDLDSYNGGYYPLEKIQNPENLLILNKIHYDFVQKALLEKLLDPKIDNIQKVLSLPKHSIAEPVNLHKGGLMKDWNMEF